jgi:pimeloyl-ACP methyl ester carboxylesterase
MAQLTVGVQPPERYIVAGIDGTGSRSWMKPDGSNSHVYRFIQDFQYGAVNIDRRYFHGPSDDLMGRESESILQDALDFIKNRLYQLFGHNGLHGVQPLKMFDVNSCQQNAYYAEQRNEFNYYGTGLQNIQIPVKIDAGMLQHQVLHTDQVKIVLVGHSRGGLAATVLAKMLAPIVRVYFLGLYDSVDRQPCLDGATVENVLHVVHAMRDPDTGSRSYFGNTSTGYSAGTRYAREYFTTSHGGIGGDYIADPKRASFGSDTACLARPDFIDVQTHYGTTKVDNRALLTKKLHRPIQEICDDGSKRADRYIREGARKLGLPVQ